MNKENKGPYLHDLKIEKTLKKKKKKELTKPKE